MFSNCIGIFFILYQTFSTFDSHEMYFPRVPNHISVGSNAPVIFQDNPGRKDGRILGVLHMTDVTA